MELLVKIHLPNQIIKELSVLIREIIAIIIINHTVTTAMPKQFKIKNLQQLQKTNHQLQKSLQSSVQTKGVLKKSQEESTVPATSSAPAEVPATRPQLRTYPAKRRVIICVKPQVKYITKVKK